MLMFSLLSKDRSLEDYFYFVRDGMNAWGRALEAYMSALVNGQCRVVYYSGVRPSAKHMFLNVSPSSRFLAHPRPITQEHTDSCNCK
jgi:hypothetical protein